MATVAITKKWYEEIKGLVEMTNEYFYQDGIFGEAVEVDVDEKEFEKVSKKLGWM